MRANIEHKIAWPHESAVKLIHIRIALAVAGIDPQRSEDPAPSPDYFEHGCDQSARGFEAAKMTAGTPIVLRITGGRVSSGNRPIPTRVNIFPNAGMAVITANGIERARPPAINDTHNPFANGPVLIRVCRGE